MMKILWRLLNDMVPVSEEEIKDAIVILMDSAHQIAEGAGAAPLAGALKMKDFLAGKRVALVSSGVT